MKKGTWLVVVGFLAVAAAGPAAAQLYAGGSLGYSQFKDICQLANVPCDDKDTAWRAFGGYQFNQYFALELGFGDLGEATGSGALGSFDIEVKEAWDLSAMISLPVSTRLSALLRLGAYRTRTTVDQQGPTIGSVHDAQTNSGFTYGAGAEYSLGKLGVRAEWQRYDNTATGTQAEDDIDVFSVGLLFRF
jgi:OmpA-OmpF porin, OOP family